MKNTLFYLCLVVFGSLNATAATAPIVLSPERANQAASLMNDGRVLITGGVNETATLDSALLYDPNGPNPRKLKVTGTMTSARSNHTSTTLTDGKVLVTGGELSNGQLLKSSELYDPATGLFTAITKAMSIPRSKHTATLLPDGRVLLVGMGSGLLRLESSVVDRFGLGRTRSSRASEIQSHREVSAKFHYRIRRTRRT